MKLTPLLTGLAVAAALAGCAQQNSAGTAPQGTDPYGIATLSQGDSSQPNVSGNVIIRQRSALPPDAVLTVTLSDASLADAPARVLSQKAVHTEGKQSPFSFVLPYNPSQIQAKDRVLLSAAVAINGRLVFVTDTVQPVINQGGTRVDLNLVPVPQQAVPVDTGNGASTGGAPLSW
ncbi:glycoprotein-polysaccharide metabolism protein [Shimwellia pseudoproteus]|uniref:YbaY family lipoprotein n=1 Tax=Shimwellia pseudoproteus TaxID=570012 RepID=UPI0018ED95B8|nr:YbaY family lipoprotein [Shimwellia pseudoproteus]MBJ3814832.1 glycoprotein-polysaccharide metabolism protein [Shimwellia pseudoproteus]